METEYAFTESEWDTLSVAPLAAAATVGGLLLVVSAYYSVAGDTPLLRSRPFRWSFIFGWTFVGFAITWGILVKLDTCGPERGEFRVQNIRTNLNGSHMVINTTRLPFKEHAKSATRSIPTDADKDEGPSGTIKYTLADGTSTEFQLEKIETKGRSMDPRLADSYAINTKYKNGDDNNVGKDIFKMPNAPEKCEKFVLRSGVNDFSHYGDVLAAFMNEHAIVGDISHLGRPANITPVPVHLYFTDADSTDLEYEGVYLLVPKWHDYECAFADSAVEDWDEYWDPGKDEFKNLMLEQTTRPDKAQASLFNTNFYPVRSRSEDFNRASLDAAEQGGVDVIEIVDSCYRHPYEGIDLDHLAISIAFNQLVPSWDMYMSSEYSVVDASTSKCYLGPLWDREVEPQINARLLPDGFVEPHHFWDFKKSKAWHIVDHHMRTNTNLLNLVKNKIPLVEAAHNKTLKWIENHTSILKEGAVRWQLPGRVCFYGYNLYPNLEWGDDEGSIPGAFTKLFNERKAWLESAATFDDRRRGIYMTAQSVILSPDGVLPLVITVSLLIGLGLLAEVAECARGPGYARI